MGRRKYTMKKDQYGRNMLIGEYLWIAYCQSLPPGVKPDPKMMRERKQVSSHIQVLKNFFLHHRCFHFFFPKEDKSDDNNRKTESFKNNPVLTALSEGRLPDERPNYEYFAQILALNDQIAVKPKRCWIFVSHQDVSVQEEGYGQLSATGDFLPAIEYPHLRRNLDREKWAKEEQQIFKGALLHEFTKELHQTASSTVKEVSDKWERSFPELHQRLESIIADDSRCDILNMHVTLELKERRRFPSQSELNSWVEINIEQPRLLNHRWKVNTRLVRPPELSYTSEHGEPETLYETSAEIAIQYQHRPGCDGPRNGGRDPCDCISQRCRRDWVTVPFPAEVWAMTLTNCAEYPAHPFADGANGGGAGGRRRAKKNCTVRGTAAGAEVKSEGDDDENADDKHNDSSTSEPAEATSRSNTRRRRYGHDQQPTQMDLVPKIAMLQEIWSCPPDSPHESMNSSGDGSSNGKWRRRAVILWSFETVHSLDKEGNLVKAPNGKTNWRFLTVLDPSSAYHQQQALLPPGRDSIGPSSFGNAYGAYGDVFTSLSPASSAAGLAREAIMSPGPSYQQHLSAEMNENFGATHSWGDGGVYGSGSALGSATVNAAAAQVAYGAHLMTQTISHHHQQGNTGLATPPPTATGLSGSFGVSSGYHPHAAHHPLSNSHHQNHHPHHPHAPAGVIDTQLSDLSAVTDPFLSANTGVPSHSSSFASVLYEDHASSQHNDDIHGWGAPSTAASWSTAPEYASVANSGHHDGSSMMHQPQQDLWTPASADTPGGLLTGSDGHDQQQHHSQQQQQQQQRGSYHVNGSLWAAGDHLTDRPATATGSHCSQEWVHVPQDVGTGLDRSGSSLSLSAGSSTADLSDEWEDIVAASAHHNHPQVQQVVVNVDESAAVAAAGGLIGTGDEQHLSVSSELMRRGQEQEGFCRGRRAISRQHTPHQHSQSQGNSPMRRFGQPHHPYARPAGQGRKRSFDGC